MDSRNIDKVLSAIKDTDRVLDVGGWAQPMKRANAVIDCFSYDTRGMYGSIGQGDERFKKADWAQHDICDRKPWPFKDKEFDFVTCSHVLEDIRDPIWACSEIVRVGKAGYVETPSRAAESMYGVESYEFTGSQHHRWLVEYESGRLMFRHKTPSLVEKRRGLYFINTEPVVSFFWKDRFDFTEVPIEQTKRAVEIELEQWIERYKSGLPVALKAFNGLNPYLPKYLQKNIQKLCRYIWKLPKV